MRRGSEAEAVAFGEPPAGASAQSALYARSVTSALPLPPAPAVPRVPGGDAASPSAARVRSALEWLSSGGHLTSRPQSLREAHAHVHEAAGRYEALLLRVPRLMWGYVWLLLKAVLNTVEWVTRSPVTFVTAAVLITVAVFFL